MDSIVGQYGDMSADELMLLVHQDSAWKNTPAGGPIGKEAIADCYRGRIWEEQ